MQDDLIERLKMHRIILKSGDYNGADLMAAWCDMMNAANQGKEDNDRIAALEAKLAKKDAQLRECGEALGPFAECAEQIVSIEDDEEWAKFRLLIKDYRLARTTLAKIKENPNG